ncbi:hypothetical protein SFC07_11080 [Corynebacterium callunae]|uniref:hypothetical protein n=1 Tax=Corynebacterium callunae TaxID=1721 RepID=UPI00398209BC
MVMNREQATDAVQELLRVHAEERKRMDEIHAAMQPWTAAQAAEKFGLLGTKVGRSRQIEIAKSSQTNYLPLILDVFSQALKVDNYYTGSAT